MTANRSIPASVLLLAQQQLAHEAGLAGDTEAAMRHETLDERAAVVAVNQRLVRAAHDAVRRGEVTPGPRAIIERAHLAQVSSSFRAVEQLGRLRAALASVGVRSIALKGPALAAQTTGDFTARTSGDIDLLVDPKDVQAAMQALVDAGAMRAEDFLPAPHSPLFPRAMDVIQEVLFHLDGREVDLHWRLDIASGCLPWSFDDLWERRQELVMGGVPVDTLGELDAAVFSASHGAKDAWSRLGQIVDHARLLRMTDWEEGVRHARAARALRRWEIAGAMASHLDGLARTVPGQAHRQADAMWRWLIAGKGPCGRTGVVPTWRSFRSNVSTYDRPVEALARSRVLIWPVRSMAARDLGEWGDRYPALYPIATPLLMPKRLAAKFRARDRSLTPA